MRLHPAEGPNRGLLRDCEIFGNLRITVVSSFSATCHHCSVIVGPTLKFFWLSEGAEPPWWPPPPAALEDLSRTAEPPSAGWLWDLQIFFILSIKYFCAQVNSLQTYSKCRLVHSTMQILNIPALNLRGIYMTIWKYVDREDCRYEVRGVSQNTSNIITVR